MMVLLQLFFEFCRVGLFSVGGGLATIPFLTDLGERTGWFSPGDLANMIAISESTPGPMGVNMATYVGFETAGLPGAVLGGFILGVLETLVSGYISATYRDLFSFMTMILVLMFMPNGLMGISNQDKL